MIANAGVCLSSRNKAVLKNKKERRERLLKKFKEIKPATRKELEQLYLTTIPYEIRKDIKNYKWQNALDALDDLLEHEQDLSPHARQMVDLVRLRCLMHLADAGKQDYWEVIQALRRHLYLYPHSPYKPWIYLSLGKCYRKEGFYPEALAYDKMVVEEFKNSPQAPKAMIEAARVLRTQHKYQKALYWLKRLIRQYPDTKSADLARLVLAQLALESNDIKRAKVLVEQIKKTDPNIYIDLPKLLLVEGEILAKQGKYKEARKRWLHYLNLQTSSSTQAKVWFFIAESLKREHFYLKARKYYVLIKQEYPDSKYALFSKFRLAQLQEIEQQSLSKYVNNIKPWEPAADTILVLKTIINQYPNSKIAQEAEITLMRYDLMLKDAFDILKQAKNFIKLYPNSRFADNVTKYVKIACNKLLNQHLDIETIKKIVIFGRDFVGLYPKSPFTTDIKNLTSNLWIKWIRYCLNKKEYLKAFKQESIYLNTFLPDNYVNTIKNLTRKTIAYINEEFISKDKPINLLNFYYIYLNTIKQINAKEENFYIAISWKKLGCLDAALRYFYMAYKANIQNKNLKNRLFISWIYTALMTNDFNSVAAILTLYRLNNKNWFDNPKIILAYAKLMQYNKNWQNIIDRCLPNLPSVRDISIKKELVYVCEKALLETKNFNKFNQIFKDYKTFLNNKIKTNLLKQVAQKELSLGLIDQAINHLKKAINIEPNDLALIWLYTIALNKAGKFKLALKEAKLLATSKDSFWASVGSALVSNISFWQGPAGSLKTKTYAFK